jgi:hypothetical protein
MAHASLQPALARAASEHVRPKSLNFPLVHAVGARNNAGGGLALRRSQQAPRMETSASTWSSMKWVRSFWTKGRHLSDLESVQTRLARGMPETCSNPSCHHSVPGAGAGVRVGMSGGRCRCRTWAWMLGRARPQTPALASVSWVYLPCPPIITPYPPANLCRQGNKGCQGGNNEAPVGDKRGQGGDQGVPGS